MLKAAEKILTLDQKDEEKFLRKKTFPCEFLPGGKVKFGETELSRKEVNELILEMKRKMREANGIGLSANQIGLPYRLFVASVSDQDGTIKFYAVFNPEIEKLGNEEVEIEEGCLSVPGIYGEVARAGQINISGFDKNGKKLKLKAWGMLARVFQHEIDHLNGILFVDKAKNLQRVEGFEADEQ